MNYLEYQKEIEKRLGNRIAILPQEKCYSIGVFRSFDGTYKGQQGNYYGVYQNKEEAQAKINEHIKFIKSYDKWLILEQYVARVVIIDGYATFTFADELPLNENGGKE